MPEFKPVLPLFIISSLLLIGLARHFWLTRRKSEQLTFGRNFGRSNKPESMLSTVEGDEDETTPDLGPEIVFPVEVADDHSGD